MLGCRNPNNDRVRNIESQIRKGAADVPLRKQRELVVNTTSLARAFMRAYIFKHKQDSPSVTTIYVDHIDNCDMYQEYLKEATEKRYKFVEQPSFEVIWRELLEEGVTDPETSAHSKVESRKRLSKGFSDCNCCSYYMMKIRGWYQRQGIKTSLHAQISTAYTRSLRRPRGARAHPALVYCRQETLWLFPRRGRQQQVFYPDNNILCKIVIATVACEAEVDMCADV